MTRALNPSVGPVQSDYLAKKQFSLKSNQSELNLFILLGSPFLKKGSALSLHLSISLHVHINAYRSNVVIIIIKILTYCGIIIMIGICII